MLCMNMAKTCECMVQDAILLQLEREENLIPILAVHLLLQNIKCYNSNVIIPGFNISDFPSHIKRRVLSLQLTLKCNDGLTA